MVRDNRRHRCLHQQAEVTWILQTQVKTGSKVTHLCGSLQAVVRMIRRLLMTYRWLRNPHGEVWYELRFTFMLVSFLVQHLFFAMSIAVSKKKKKSSVVWSFQSIFRKWSSPTCIHARTHACSAHTHARTHACSVHTHAAHTRALSENRQRCWLTIESLYHCYRVFHQWLDSMRCCMLLW